MSWMAVTSTLLQWLKWSTNLTFNCHPSFKIKIMELFQTFFHIDFSQISRQQSTWLNLTKSLLWHIWQGCGILTLVLIGATRGKRGKPPISCPCCPGFLTQGLQHKATILAHKLSSIAESSTVLVVFSYEIANFSLGFIYSFCAKPLGFNLSIALFWVFANKKTMRNAATLDLRLGLPAFCMAARTKAWS